MFWIKCGEMRKFGHNFLLRNEKGATIIDCRAAHDCGDAFASFFCLRCLALSCSFLNSAIVVKPTHSPTNWTHTDAHTQIHLNLTFITWGRSALSWSHKYHGNVDGDTGETRGWNGCAKKRYWLPFQWKVHLFVSSSPNRKTNCGPTANSGVGMRMCSKTL